MRFVYAVLLTAAGLVLLVWLIPAAPMTGDGQYYIQFVRNGFQHAASSWHERRILGPLIVRALPMDAQDGFFVLTIACLAVTSLLTWLAAREVVAGNRALLAIPLLFGTWVVAPNVREFGLVDPLAWVFLSAVWLATLHRNWWLAAIIAASGVLAKEVVALAALASAAAFFEPQRPWRAIAVGAPSLLVVFALTLVLPGSGSDAIAYLFKWVRDGLFSNGAARAVFLVFASYGALWFLLPRGWPALPMDLKRAGIVFLIAAVALPFVGSPERMEEAIFPFVISAALLATRDWTLPLVWVFAIGCAVFAARVGGDARIPTAVAWSGLALSCALAVLSYLPMWSLVRFKLALRRYVSAP
jgi:hypothetical protein